MAEKKNKQLLLVVEGSPTMSIHWNTILCDYLPQIIRAFCGNDDAELGLVVFDTNQSSMMEMSKRYGLTSDSKVLFDWLSFINFKLGDSSFIGTIADGLDAAFMLFDETNASENWHCILVAASNPDTLPYEQSDRSITAAQSYSKFKISLSVICPEHYPVLKEIYNAGRIDGSVNDHTIHIDKYPEYLVLISEKLVKNCGDLSQWDIIPVLQNPSAAQDPVNWNPVADRVQGPSSSKTSELDPFAYTNKSILNKLSRQARFEILPRMSAIGGSSVGECSYGNNEARQSIPETGTIMLSLPPQPLVPYYHVQSQSYGVKVWEGDLYGLNNGVPACMARLEGYIISSSSKLIAGDWPMTMLIDNYIFQDEMSKKELADKTYPLVFRAKDHLSFRRFLQGTNNCALIRLPREILVLAPAISQQDEFNGMLFSSDEVKIIPQVLL